MVDWYDTLEPDVRDVVRLLRNNGFNTECSCEHDKYIQCAYFTDGELMRMDNLLFTNGYRDYEIKVNIIREEGHLRSSIDICFTDLHQLKKEE